MNFFYSSFSICFSLKTNTKINPYKPKKLNPLSLNSQTSVNSQTLSLSQQTLFSSLAKLDLILSTLPSQTHTPGRCEQ